MLKQMGGTCTRAGPSKTFENGEDKHSAGPMRDTRTAAWLPPTKELNPQI